MRYADIQALTKTGYFSCDGNGRMRLAIELGYGIIDSHAHVGWNYLLSRPVDLHRKTETVSHYFPETGIAVDTDDISVYDVPKPVKRRIRRSTIETLVTTRGQVRTHTFPNLIDEMDRMQVEASVILPIEMFRSDNSTRVITGALRYGSRFVPYGSVHPRRKDKDSVMRKLAAMGARGFKLHPPLQLVAPDAPHTYEVLEIAGALGLPVLFHCGYSPLTSPVLHPFTKIESYERAVKDFPGTKIILGHSGYHDMLRLASFGKAHPNLYLEVSGQSPDNIRDAIRIMGPERLLFGTDWPYYPIALTLVKTLMATEGLEHERKMILRENAIVLDGALVSS